MKQNFLLGSALCLSTLLNPFPSLKAAAMPTGDTSRISVNCEPQAASNMLSSFYNNTINNNAFNQQNISSANLSLSNLSHRSSPNPNMTFVRVIGYFDNSFSQAKNNGRYLQYEFTTTNSFEDAYLKAVSVHEDRSYNASVNGKYGYSLAVEISEDNFQTSTLLSQDVIVGTQLPQNDNSYAEVLADYALSTGGTYQLRFYFYANPSANVAEEDGIAEISIDLLNFRFETCTSSEVVCNYVPASNMLSSFYNNTINNNMFNQDNIVSASLNLSNIWHRSSPNPNMTFVRLISYFDNTYQAAKINNRYLQYQFTTSQDFENSLLEAIAINEGTSYNEAISTKYGYKVAVEISDDNFQTSTLLSQDNVVGTEFPVTDNSYTDIVANYELSGSTTYKVRFYFYDNPQSNNAEEDAFPEISIDFLNFRFKDCEQIVISEDCSATGLSADSVSLLYANMLNTYHYGIGNDGYHGYFNRVGYGTPGASENISLYLKPVQGQYPTDVYTTCWVDYNNDGDYTDPGEEVASGAFVNGYYSTQVTIPSNMPTVGWRTMRVAVKKGSAPVVCEIFEEGQVVDYSFIFWEPLFKSLETEELENGGNSVSDKMNVYPNPSQGTFNIELPTTFLDGDINVQLMDISGKIIKDELIDNNGEVFSFEVEDVPNGVYLLSVRAGDRKFMERVNIKH